MCPGTSIPLENISAPSITLTVQSAVTVRGLCALRVRVRARERTTERTVWAFRHAFQIFK